MDKTQIQAEVTALHLERDMRKMAEARNAELLQQRSQLLAALRDCVLVMERELEGLKVIQPELNVARAAISAAEQDHTGGATDMAADLERLRPMADEVQAARHVMREHNRLLVELASRKEELRATKEVEFPRKVEAVVRKVETKWQAELAASQALERQLRSVLQRIAEQAGGCYAEWAAVALAAPQDTSALEAIVARACEVMQERCAEKIESQHTWVTSAAASALIRALPGVKLEDLQK